jgi:hypothetical protein
MAKPRSLSKNVTVSSFKVSNLIVKNWKSFTEGEFVNECFLEIAYNSFGGYQSNSPVTTFYLDGF